MTKSTNTEAMMSQNNIITDDRMIILKLRDHIERLQSELKTAEEKASRYYNDFYEINRKFENLSVSVEKRTNITTEKNVEVMHGVEHDASMILNFLCLSEILEENPSVRAVYDELFMMLNMAISESDYLKQLRKTKEKYYTSKGL